MSQGLHLELDEIERENDMHFAFIEGVKQGLLIAKSDEKYSEDEFNDKIRNSFRDWLESYDG